MHERTEGAAGSVPDRHGRLQAARLSRLWVALVGALLALSAATMLVSLWPYYLQVSTACADTGFCFPPALFTHDVPVLARYGISLTAYATLVFLLQLVANLGHLGLASVLFWWRRNDQMALCTVAVLATQPLAPSGYLTAIIDLDGPGPAVIFAAALTIKVVSILFLALFPAVRLTDDLTRSREWLVDAREEERRRLQRDLHDGLGPTLASMSMQLAAARVQLANDAVASEALLAEVQAELKETVGTVCRLVHELRPPLLDQLGLSAAVREHALRVGRGAGVRVDLEPPEMLPPLSAAVELAAYYIVVEALNNMARHARARSCIGRLRARRSCGSR